MSPEIVTSKTDNIAIIILTVAVFALGAFLAYFIKKSVSNQEQERIHSQKANEKTIELLIAQKDALNDDLKRREAENRTDRQRYEEIQEKTQEKFTNTLDQITKRLTEKLDSISCDVGIVKNDVEQLKDKP